MSHQSGYCDCGRKKHYPKNAPLGYQWTCYRCGRTYVLSTYGNPLHTQGSRPPSGSSYGSSGCLVIIAAPLVLLLLAVKLLAG